MVGEGGGLKEGGTPWGAETTDFARRRRLIPRKNRKGSLVMFRGGGEKKGLRERSTDPEGQKPVPGGKSRRQERQGVPGKRRGVKERET